MRRILLLIAVFGLLVALAPRLANAGLGCCVCSSCGSDPDPCGAPLISCDITCGQVGCSGSTTGDSEQCMLLPPCSPPALITNPAPTASVLGLALVSVGLAGLGARRLARRRRGR